MMPGKHRDRTAPAKDGLIEAAFLGDGQPLDERSTPIHEAEGSKKRRCIVHIGLPKTATTTFQRHVFSRHSQLEYLGKYLGRRQIFRDRAVERIITSAGCWQYKSGTSRPAALLEGRPLKTLSELFDRHVGPAADAGRTPLWSSEGICLGTPAQRRRRAVNLRAVFGPCKILITIRHPVRFTEALYLQKLREANGIGWRNLGKPPRYFSIDQWMTANWPRTGPGDLTALEYAGTIDIFADVFGRDAVGVFLFEQLVEDRTTFLDALCEFLDIDAPECNRLAGEKHENVRWTRDQIQRLIRMQRSVPRSTAFRMSPPHLRRRMLALPPYQRADGSEKYHQDLPKRWKALIQDETRSGNRRLADEWQLPLERYGYPL